MSDDRRPISQRSAGWAQASAARLARLGLSADAVSALGLGAAVLGAALFLASGATEGGARTATLLGAAVCIQLRLLCNMLDGMVAVEHGRGGPLGPIWNELPDRLADLLFLVGAGYGAQLAGAAWAAHLGWAAGVCAVLTAYVRELGRAAGRPADFSGPLAKPRRMFLLTVATLISAAEPLWDGDGKTLAFALGLIALGSAFTVVNRTARLARALRAA